MAAVLAAVATGEAETAGVLMVMDKLVAGMSVTEALDMAALVRAAGKMAGAVVEAQVGVRMAQANEGAGPWEVLEMVAGDEGLAGHSVAAEKAVAMAEEVVEVRTTPSHLQTSGSVRCNRRHRRGSTPETSRRGGRRQSGRRTGCHAQPAHSSASSGPRDSPPLHAST